MLRAVFARTLKPGVSYEEFVAAWVPEPRLGAYPARASISRNLSDDRQVLTVIELDVAPDELSAVLPRLTRPDALERVSELIVSTPLEGVYHQVLDDSSF
ncbi:MAG: hypothetical protein H0T54_03500 [Geodermatophilaceae bacterium]|nr:hypothetical protein [Geodermatophilaceae bacterium]